MSTRPSVLQGTQLPHHPGGLRVQDIEPEIPPAGWDVVVDGLVAESVAWSFECIRAMASEHRVWDLRCVSGRTRMGLSWEGVPAGRFIDMAHPLPQARFVMVTAAGEDYASCLSLDDASRSMLAWGLDGTPLAPEQGGPLRLVPPPTTWGCKGVKWVARLTLVKSFRPAPWENLAGEPQGDFPRQVIDLVDHDD